MLRPLLEHVGVLRAPALWMLGRRQPDQVELDGCTYKVHPRDFGVTLELHSTGDYEQGTRRCIFDMLQPGMTFIDIGANLGYYSLLFIASGYKVYAIEPFGANRRALQASLCLLEHADATGGPIE